MFKDVCQFIRPWIKTIDRMNKKKQTSNWHRDELVMCVCTRTTFVRDKVRTPSTHALRFLCVFFFSRLFMAAGHKTKVQLQSPRVRAN